MNFNPGEISFVKFYATWCAPCKALDKTVKIVQSEFPEVNFKEVDIDIESDLANSYRIKSIPTVVIFRGSEEIQRVVGSIMIDAMRKLLRDSVNSK